MFGNWKKRRMDRQALCELSQLDAHLLRDMGLHPDDFCDAMEGRRSSLLFTPFRNPRKR
ncbi:MAG: DUF1127 domain-containing protein [Devosia sp.]